MFGLFKNIITPLFIAFLFAGSSTAVGPLFHSDSSDNFKEAPVTRECNFYFDVLEQRYPCGESGYAVGYGGKYCRVFGANRDELSEKGDKWRISAMKCLINSLRMFLLENAENRSLSCQSIKEYGFDSHPKCYTSTNPSFCDLKPKDYRTVLRLIKRKDLLSKLGRQQIAQVARTCIGNKINAVRGKAMPTRPGTSSYSVEKIKLLEEIAALDKE